MNESALLEAVRQAMKAQPSTEGITTRELADSLRVGMATAREALRQMIRQGKAEPLMALRRGMDGKLHGTPVYRLVNGKKK